MIVFWWCVWKLRRAALRLHAFVSIVWLPFREFFAVRALRSVLAEAKTYLGTPTVRELCNALLTLPLVGYVRVTLESGSRPTDELLRAMIKYGGDFELAWDPTSRCAKELTLIAGSTFFGKAVPMPRTSFLLVEEIVQTLCPHDLTINVRPYQYPWKDETLTGWRLKSLISCPTQQTTDKMGAADEIQES